MYSCFFLKTYCLFKKNFCKHWIIIICHCIAGKECMNTEFFCTFCFQCLKCFCDLLCCHSILRISRIIHNIITDLEYSARIITATDCLRNMSDCLLKEVNMCNIIQIDDCSKFISKFKIFLRCIIRGKHNIMTINSNCI